MYPKSLVIVRGRPSSEKRDGIALLKLLILKKKCKSKSAANRKNRLLASILGLGEAGGIAAEALYTP
ncbi:Putative uncharacterized protein [Neochlamydia sp. S13]|nr:Putative uncharacterized protein [Neochlamydia sp. S13]